MPSSEIDLFWRPPKFRSLPPPAGPGGKPRNEAYEALHAITDKLEFQRARVSRRRRLSLSLMDFGPPEGAAALQVRKRTEAIWIVFSHYV